MIRKLVEKFGDSYYDPPDNKFEDANHYELLGKIYDLSNENKLNHKQENQLEAIEEMIEDLYSDVMYSGKDEF